MFDWTFLILRIMQKNVCVSSPALFHQLVLFIPWKTFQSSKNGTCSPLFPKNIIVLLFPKKCAAWCVFFRWKHIVTCSWCSHDMKSRRCCWCSHDMKTNVSKLFSWHEDKCFKVVNVLMTWRQMFQSGMLFVLSWQETKSKFQTDMLLFSWHENWEHGLAGNKCGSLFPPSALSVGQNLLY